jgi:uncharacterized membrane protein YphA (DoxX/SURF4 family)
MKKYLTLKNLGWLLTAIVAIMLGMSGTSKIMGTQEMIGNFTYFHLLPYLPAVGAVELIGVALLVIPRTSIIGAVVLGSVMAAASVMHLSYLGGQGLLIPVVLGSLSWCSYLLRTNPLTKTQTS